MVSLRFWNMDITLTIQIAPEGDKETRDSVYQVLDGWRQACMSMSNLIMMHLLTQENIANMFYLTEGTKVKLGNQGENSIFNTSRQNATYRIMAKHDLPSDIIANINTRTVTFFNKNKKEIFKGQMRIPYYKNNTPIPFSKQSISFYAEKGSRRIYKFRLFKHRFICILGKDKAGYSYRLDKIIEGNISHCNASLYFNKHNRKWFLLLPIPVQEARPTVDPDLICYAELNPDIPIMATFGNENIGLGNADEFEYRRQQLSEKLRRLQMDSRFSRGGHGRGQKLQAIDRFNEKESNYVQDKLHKYSAALVGNCIRKGYGTIVLTKTKGEASKDDTDSEEITAQYRYWSPGELTRLIKYKASINGLKVTEV